MAKEEQNIAAVMQEVTRLRNRVAELEQAEAEKQEAQILLQESERRYRQLIDTSSDMIQSVGIDGRFLFVNRAWLDRMGYVAEEIAALTIFDIIHPDSAAHCREIFEEAIKGKWFKGVQAVFVSKEGDNVHIEGNISPRKAGGKVVGTHGCFRDITERKMAEEAFSTYQRQYIQVVESASEVIFTTDGDGDLSYVNRTGRELTGFSLEELQNFHYLDIVAVSHRKRVQIHYMRQFLERKSATYIEFPLATKTGEELWFGQNANIELEGDKVVGFHCIARDITERKKAEEALKASEERFRHLYENTTIGFYRTSPAGKILMANPALVEMLGYSSFQELADRNLEKSGFEPSYPREIFKSLIGDRQEIRGLESAWKRKDGTIIFVRESAKVFKDDKGNALYYEGTVEDITDRKKAELALRDSEYRLRALYESASEGIFIVNKEGGIIDVNPAVHNMFGYERVEILRTNIVRLLFPQDKSAKRKMQNIIKEGIFFPEFRSQRKDGSKIWVEISITNMLLKEELLFLIIMRDITERKTAEERLRASLQEKDVLIKEIHHRVKNNLQFMSSLLDIQSSYITDERAQAIFSESRSRIRTIALIHEKLYVSRNLSEIDFGELVKSLTSSILFTHSINPGLVNIIVEIREISLELGAAIPCAMIINELVTNSLKHGFQPGEELEIIVRMFLQDGMYHLQVWDNGSGFVDEFQLDRSESMGLQLVKTLVEQLHGTVETASEKGARVNISFPVGLGD